MAETAMEREETTDRSMATFGDDSSRMSNPAPSWMSRIEEHSAWPKLSHLELTMAVEVSLLRFKVQDLLRLSEGQVFESGCSETEDVPLKIGSVQIGWTEFEVVDQKISLRLTRLV
jgi:flagellar motor switch/type III secretory pathway protein FliN